MTTYQLNFSPVFSQTNKNSKFVLILKKMISYQKFFKMKFTYYVKYNEQKINMIFQKI